MVYYGADVPELRAVAQSCDQAANSVKAIVFRLNTVLSDTAWAGPDAASFRSSWHGAHRAALVDTESALRSVATVLRHNADQQEGVSAASTGATAAAPVSSSYGKGSQEGNPAPANAQQLWYTLRNMSGSDSKTGTGYRVQIVRGDDDQYRMVVYINGTYGGKDLTWQSNGGAMLDIPTAETAAVEKAMSAALDKAKAEGIPVSQIQLAGYSQGGMIAQNIADSGKYHVSTVVTFGSPVLEVPNDYGGAQMIRISDTADVVPEGIMPGFAQAGRNLDSWGAFFSGHGPDTSGSDNLDFSYSDPEAARDQAAVQQAYADEMRDPLTAPFLWAGSAFAKQTYTLPDHGSTWMYGDDAARFDADQSASAQEGQSSIAKFGGTVVFDDT